jgi:hypothetical protein
VTLSFKKQVKNACSWIELQLEEKREVSSEEGAAFARKHGCLFQGDQALSRSGTCVRMCLDRKVFVKGVSNCSMCNYSQKEQWIKADPYKYAVHMPWLIYLYRLYFAAMLFA